VASPVAADGVVYAGSSYDTRALMAIRLDGARGDITGTKQVVWSRQRGTPYVPSPLLYGDSLYTLQHYQESFHAWMSQPLVGNQPFVVALGDAPCPISIMAMTAAMPMTIPRQVNIERIRLHLNARAVRKVRQNDRMAVRRSREKPGRNSGNYVP